MTKHDADFTFPIQVTLPHDLAFDILPPPSHGGPFSRQGWH